MSFFQKDDTQKNLQYDDIAFLHFMLTMSLVSVAIFGFLVYKRLKQANIKNIKNYKALKQSGLFQQQLKNQAARLKEEKITVNFWIMVGVLILSIVVSAGLAYFINTHTTQMIGFDPHEILGVAPEATINQIKKAYRKLALQLHPDRNPNNPEAHAKFIMVSKSYQCLTDQTKKQNCLKFGNPDGQASFEVGIGLPKMLISKQNQFIILPIVFLILLFVVPLIFINWTKHLKSKDNEGLDISNYPALYPFYRPDFNASFGFYLVTALKELQTDKKLDQKQKQEFIQFLTAKKLIDVKYVTQKLSDGQLYVLHQLLRQMAMKQPDADLCKQLPQLLNGLMKFSLYFARRINDKKPLFGDDLIINWIGTQHIFMLLEFTRTFYNCSLFNPPAFTHFDHLDLQNDDRQISLKNPVPIIRQLLQKESKKKQHLSLFPEHHREYIEKQLNDLPILNLEVKFVLGKNQVHEFTGEDFPDIVFRASKKNKTSGYCWLPKFPYLKEEKYYFVLIYGNNLLHFQQVIFEQGKQQFVGKFPYKQIVPRQMKCFAFLFSDCRYGLDVQTQLNFVVKEPTVQQQQKQVEINEQDLLIQKLPKNAFEKALSLEVQNPSDNQLSDTEDQEPSKEEKKPKLRMVEERGGCGGCKDHDH